MVKDREYELFVAPDAKVVVCRSSKHPIEYAIMLLVLRDGNWHTVRTYDNAHAPEHHEHRYAGDRKLEPAITEGTVNHAMSEAQRMILDGWREMVDDWEQTR